VALDDALRARREANCLAHVKAENAHRFDEAIALFARPRYEIVATGELYDGSDGVERLLVENVTAFPDFWYDLEKLHHAEDAVVVEGTFRGTHEGPWRGLPATGRKVAFPMLIVFSFDGEDNMGERLYFDLHTVLRQLGIARDPNSMGGKIESMLLHPLTILKALFRKLFRRKKAPAASG
jgi:steroid delta-isomerase-like uncharacterized protein